ncbi:MAG: folate family ECF transporter S component [Dorea sp.]|jgi:ECF transporter S component (folate family)|nr:folate family ECF transporter S component [Dorea sp.]
MKGLKALFADSIHELRDLRTLAVASMLLAIAVVLGFYTLQLTDYIKIGFAYIVNEMTGMLFGPAVGGIMGGLADLLKYLVNPTGPFFPGFTISGICGGIIYGLVLYKKPLTVKRVILANLLVTVSVNIFLNTYWLTLLYGDAFLVLLPARILKQAVMMPIEVVLFYTVAKVLTKANIFAMMRGMRVS